jgi:ureidoacrylate peracid hydrolase
MYTTLAEKVDPKHTALIVVDVQNDFCHEDSPYTAGRGDLGPIQAAARRLNTLIERARNAGALVVFIQNVTRPGSRTEVQLEHTLRTGSNSDPERSICLEGSWGSEFYVVSPTEEDLVVQKIRYSAFIRTGLEELLKERGIETLVMTGVSTNTCVESTMRDGFMLDFYVVLTDDCCGDYSPEYHKGAVTNTLLRFGVVATADEIESVWAGVPASVG